MTKGLSLAVLLAILPALLVLPAAAADREPGQGNSAEPRPIEKAGAEEAIAPLGLPARIAAALGACTVLVAALAIGGRMFRDGRKSRRRQQNKPSNAEAGSQSQQN